MVEVIMPKMGDGMEEGTLVEWLKAEGEKVKSGDIIGNIQTDKATVELTSPSSGILNGFLIKPGQTVPVGVPIAAVLREGESLPAGWASETTSSVASEQKVEVVQAVASGSQKVEVASPQRGTRVFASPLARKLAEESGISLESISGTGPDGRIVERDIKAASKTTSVALPKLVASGRDEIIQLNNLRKITAQRTAQSKQQVPHYYVTSEVDLESLEEVRSQMKRDDPDIKISINDFIIKACALALVEMPQVNATFDNNQEHRFGSVNIGVAAAVPDGLTLPVLHNCESKTLRQIASEVRELVARARENKLRPEELSGSTFSISNMGMFDVENFAAIINQPNGAILAVSSARRVPAVIQGEDEEELQIRTRMKMTGSFDHRIIDGAVGAQFLGVVKKYLEAPTRLLA